jgi:hypothetical protein
MPDHDLYDDQGALDAAFALLEQDVTTLSTAPGAGAAVARARRRRRTRVGAVAAAAVLAVGGVAVAQGVGHHSAALEPTSSLPTPGPLDAAALTEATRGWTGAWDTSTPSESHLIDGPVLHCLDKAPAANDANDSAQPARTSGNAYFNAGDAASLLVMVDAGDKTTEADTLWTGLTTTVGQCGNATVSGQRAWDGGEAVSYALTSPSGKTEYLWIARTGSTFGMIWVAKAPAPVPARNDTALMTALVSALQWPASYQDIGSLTGPSTTESSSASVAYPTVSDTAFARALGDWPSAWQRRGEKSPETGVPCDAEASQTGSTAGMGSSLGGNGEQEYDQFNNAGDATISVAAMTQALRDCAGATYAVSTVPTSSGGTVTVAAGASPGDAVLWVVQDGPAIAYIRVPASTTPPPDSVSAQIGDLLLSNLSQARPGDEPESSSSATAGTP